MALRKTHEKARIVQFADDGRTLPDGSKIIYAENDEKIVLYHKHPLERGTSYVYDRKSGRITVNGKEGTNNDKKLMIKLGGYMLDNVHDYELVTVSVTQKGQPG
ncbi:hypothetical protein EB093_01000 [bacterium]|nr:hypothetical protein [bacterium]